MSAKNYTAQTPIDHDGKRYEEGDSIALEDAHAKPLLALNAIAIVDKNNDGKADKTKK